MSSISTTDVSTHAGTRQAALLACALGLPGAVLIVATVVMLAGLPFGIDPIWRVEPMTLAEAAALHDDGEIVRLIRSGADPNKADTVRRGFVHNEAQILTPLEAAVGARRADIVELLLESGASLDAATRTRLLCFADVVDAGDVSALLETRRPEDGQVMCESVETPW